MDGVDGNLHEQKDSVAHKATHNSGPPIASDKAFTDRMIFSRGHTIWMTMQMPTVMLLAPLSYEYGYLLDLAVGF